MWKTLFFKHKHSNISGTIRSSRAFILPMKRWESTSPPFEAEWDSVAALLNRIQWRGCCMTPQARSQKVTWFSPSSLTCQDAPPLNLHHAVQPKLACAEGPHGKVPNKQVA